MGRILAPFGVKGWVKIETFSESPEALARIPSWWIRGPGGGEWSEARPEEVCRRGTRLLARFENCDSPEAAAGYRGKEISVAREALPPVAEHEVYQVDMIGLEVSNLDGERLGTVAGLFHNGAHEVLRLASEGGERLLPFVAPVVRSVDVDAGRIVVDWGRDW